MNVLAVLADLMIGLGLLLTTLAVIGIYRMPDVYTQLHASGKAAFLGTLAFLAAATLAGEGAIDAKVVLIAAFLVLTSPVGAHVIARAAHARGEPMVSSLDESSPDAAIAGNEPAGGPPGGPTGAGS